MLKRVLVLMTLLIVVSLVFIMVQRHPTQDASHLANSSVVNQAVSSSSSVKEGTTNSLKASDEIVSEDYHVTRDDITLFGVITAPKDYQKTKRPLVVISHGFGNTLEMYEDYATHLAKLGFVVYRFDFYGGSRASKSGGEDMLSMSVLTEKADLEAVVSKLSAESFVDESAITLLGASQGGVVSTLYAAAYPDSVHKLVLIFPAYVLFDDVRETYNNLGISSIDEIPSAITHRNSRLGGIYLRDALSVNIDSEIEKVQAPVLIIQGTDDEVVPYDYAVNANQRFAQSELVTVEGGGHWMDSQFNQVALPAIDNFLKR